MKKIFLIFIVVITISLVFINYKDDKKVVEAPSINYITVTAEGYCQKPGTYKVPDSIDKTSLLNLVGASSTSIYVDFEIEDGLVIYFYEPPSDPIVIQTATYDELISLPGIGDAKANRILEYLKQNDYFNDWEEFFTLVSIKNEESRLNIQLKAVLR